MNRPYTETSTKRHNTSFFRGIAMEKIRETIVQNYDKSIAEYKKTQALSDKINEFIKINERIDSLADPFDRIPLRGGWYGDFLEHPDFLNPRWSALMAARRKIAEQYPFSYPIRYIEQLKEGIQPPGAERISYPNVIIFGICDSISCEEEGYNCRICDPYNEISLFVPDEYDKEYILSSLGQVVLINVYIDDSDRVFYSNEYGYQMNIPVNLEVEDISLLDDLLNIEGTQNTIQDKTPSGTDFGF